MAHDHIAIAEAPPSYARYFIDQQHAAYTTAEHAVWRQVLSRNASLIENYAHRMHPDYVGGMRALALPAHIPTIEDINRGLEPTGWRIVCVDGYIPTAAYVGMMSASIFPVSRMVRRAEHIDFAPAPDFVHDVLGHLPMLFSSQYREFLRRIAGVMSKAVPNALDAEFYEAGRAIAAARGAASPSAADIASADGRMERVIAAIAADPSELTHLRRMYVWSIEFGLLGDCNSYSIHGAALLSSPTEFRLVCDGAPSVRPFSLDVVQHENAFSDVLSQYFVARDFAQLDEVLTNYEHRMLQHVMEPRRSEVRELSKSTNKRRSPHA